jgi:hypothetical protein
MTDRIVIISPDGTIKEISTTVPPGLSELQQLCGGYIERVPLFDTYEGEKCKAYADEDGKMRALPANSVATDRWYDNEKPPGSWRKDVLAGDIVILQGKAMKGW